MHSSESNFSRWMSCDLRWHSPRIAPVFTTPSRYSRSKACRHSLSEKWSASTAYIGYTLRLRRAVHILGSPYLVCGASNLAAGLPFPLVTKGHAALHNDWFIAYDLNWRFWPIILLVMPAVIESELARRFHEEVTRSTVHELVRRVDIKTSLTPNDTQRTTLIIAGVYVIVIGLLWCVLKSPCLECDGSCSLDFVFCYAVWGRCANTVRRCDALRFLNETGTYLF